MFNPQLISNLAMVMNGCLEIMPFTFTVFNVLK